MRSGPFEEQLVFRFPVDQDPIGFDVTITSVDPIADERMVFIFLGKRISLDEKLDQRGEFFGVFSFLNLFPDIFLKL